MIRSEKKVKDSGTSGWLTYHLYQTEVVKNLNLNLNLNSSLVKRQIDNPSPGAVTGGN